MKTLDTSVPVLLVTVALFVGCGRDPGPVDPATLRIVPQPDLSRLSETVRHHLREEREALDEVLRDPDSPLPELAGQFARLGRHYHAYGLSKRHVRLMAGVVPMAFEWLVHTL